MSQMAGLTSFTTNTVISSSEMNANNTIITATYNAHDIASTAVHNVGAGSVVGTTLTQTLANKTMTSPVLTGTVNVSSLTAFTGSLPESGFAAAAAIPTANKMVNEAIIKAWADVYISPLTYTASYNVDSISEVTNGTWRVNFKIPFASNEYVVIVTPNNGLLWSATATRTSSAQCTIYTFDSSGTKLSTAPFSFIAIGAQ